MFEYLNQPEVIRYIVTIGSMSLLFVGFFGLLTQKEFIKIFMSIAIMESSIFLFFIGNIFDLNLHAPIITQNYSNVAEMNDPIPHAMILTAIVIGMAVLALGVSLSIEYFTLTKNSKIDQMKAMKH